MDSVGLYLSVPFCRAKCTFCNFASDAFPPARMAAYVDRLCAEIAASGAFAERNQLQLPSIADTIFIGGGTPSLLEPEQMSRIFDSLQEAFDVIHAAEITVEAAPGQISDAMLEAMLTSGVNRISLGVQSFVDEESRAVGRTHTGKSCLSELARLRSAGVANLNVDLIAGLPHQTATSWRSSLQQAIESGVEHVSVYMLEVDDDSRLGRELIGPGVRYGAHATPAESLVADLYVEACEMLNAAGLHQYEISNFARSGYRSTHNCKYWTRAPYLGFGLDAHSMMFATSNRAAARFCNGDDFDRYMAVSDEPSIDHIDELAAFEETIFLGLRLVEGVSITKLLQQYSREWVETLKARALTLQADGLIRITDDTIALTAQGRIVSSSIFGELLAEEITAAG